MRALQNAKSYPTLAGKLLQLPRIYVGSPQNVTTVPLENKKEENENKTTLGLVDINRE